MMAQVTQFCPHCGNQFCFSSNDAGKSGACPHCKVAVYFGGGVPTATPSGSPGVGMARTVLKLVGFLFYLPAAFLVAQAHEYYERAQRTIPPYTWPEPEYRMMAIYGGAAIVMAIIAITLSVAAKRN